MHQVKGSQDGPTIRSTNVGHRGKTVIPEICRWIRTLWLWMTLAYLILFPSTFFSIYFHQFPMLKSWHESFIFFEWLEHDTYTADPGWPRSEFGPVSPTFRDRWSSRWSVFLGLGLYRPPGKPVDVQNIYIHPTSTGYCLNNVSTTWLKHYSNLAWGHEARGRSCSACFWRQSLSTRRPKRFSWPWENNMVLDNSINYIGVTMRSIIFSFWCWIKSTFKANNYMFTNFKLQDWPVKNQTIPVP